MSTSMVLSRIESKDASKRLPTKTALTLGALQVAVGVMMVCLNVACLIIHTDITKSGYGIWGGLIFVVTGGLQIGASFATANESANVLIVSTMIMCIVSALTSSTIVVVFSPIALMYTHGECDTVSRAYAKCIRDETYCDVQARLMSAMLQYMLLGLSLVEVMLAIWSAALCCKITCSERQPDVTRETMISPILSPISTATKINDDTMKSKDERRTFSEELTKKLCQRCDPVDSKSNDKTLTKALIPPPSPLQPPPPPPALLPI